MFRNETFVFRIVIVALKILRVARCRIFLAHFVKNHE
jgi:hypothetical protein